MCGGSHSKHPSFNEDLSETINSSQGPLSAFQSARGSASGFLRPFPPRRKQRPKQKPKQKEGVESFLEMVINPIVGGVFIPIIRIHTKGGMSLSPNIGIPSCAK